MASIEYIVNGSGTLGTFLEKAGLQVDRLNEDLDQLSRQVATPAVDLQDSDAVYKMARIAQQIDKLKEKVADPEVKLAPAAYEKARLQILRLTAQLDRLNHKDVTVTVSVRQKIGGVLSQLKSAATGETGIFGGVGGFLSSPVGLGAIAGGGLGLAALVPGVAGLGLGGLAGAGALGGGLFGAETGNKVIKADQEKIKQITAALKTAIGGQKKELSQSLKEANRQYTKDMSFFAPFMAFQGAIKHLATDFLKPLRPIMEPLTQIVQEFGKGLADLSPQFTALFKASLPFLKQFAGIMLQAGKILLPAFTDALNQMVKSGALKIMSDGLVVLIKGVAGFIKALGPGMQASAKVFANVMGFIAHALPVLGKIFSAIADVIGGDWSPRHLWNILLNSAKAFFRAIVDSAKAFWHDIAHWFDVIRHGIATVWDTIWRNTVTRVRNGIGDVIGWVKTLPGRAVGALFGLGHRLASFMHDAFTEMWNAAKHVGSSIWHWLTDWVQKLPAWLRSLLHINSPSGVFYDIGKNMMLGLFHGIKDHAQAAKNAWGGAIDFNPSLGVKQWAPLVKRALMMEGLSPTLTGRVLYQMQTESGGNPRAINLWDSNAAAGTPSKGLMQVIDPTFSAYHWPGTSWNIYNPLANIAAALNYARHVYGSTLMNQYGGIGSGKGYALGGIISEPIWGIGASGRRYTFGERGPETVIPGVRRGGGSTYNITINAPSGNGREIGRQIVTYIKQFEAGSGSGWRR